MKLKKQLKSISIFICSFALTLIMLEIFLHFSKIAPTISYEIDKKLGQVFKKNQTFLFINEGFSVGKVNSSGYIGKEYKDYKKQKKDRSMLRIALVGDSYVEGLQVFEEHHFKTYLESKLIKDFNINTQVLNFGKSGLDINTAFYYYNFKVKEFSPDLVLFFIDKNDLLKNYKPGTSSLPFYKFNKGKLIVDNSYQNSFIYLLRSNLNGFFNTSFGKLLVKNYFLYKEGQTKKILFDKFVNEIEEKPKEKKGDIPIVNEKIIDQLTKNNNIIFVLKNKLTDNLMESLRKTDLLELGPVLEDLKNKGIDPYYWKVSSSYGHWNHEAHKAIGEYIAEEISKKIKK